MDDLTQIHIDPAKFKTARKKRGLSQQAAATAVGVQKAAISKIENGYGLPSADILARLCILLNVPITQLTRTGV